LDQTRTRTDRPRLALSLSIVLNLFLLSVIAGHVIRHRPRAAELAVAGTPMTRALARAETALDRKDAAAFRATLERERPRYGQAAEQVAAARRALASQITAEPFDPHAASQALEAWRTSWDSFMSDFSGPLIDALSSISPQGRRQLIDARREQRERQQSAADRIAH
jgi:uncharacterized membrane protein